VTIQFKKNGLILIQVYKCVNLFRDEIDKPFGFDPESTDSG